MKKLLIALLGAVFATGNVTAQNYPKNIVGLRAGFNTSWVTSYRPLPNPLTWLECQTKCC